MLQILIHSSKTMRVPASQGTPLSSPQLLAHAQTLASMWRNTPVSTLASLMDISAKKAEEVVAMYQRWGADEAPQTPAVETFVGDIYSGLQVSSWSKSDKAYAQKHLLVLSGLYGALRPFDCLQPYRLEMAYKLPDGKSMYAFWGNRIAELLPAETSYIINLSAIEYTKALLPYTTQPVITPKFLTISTKTGEPTFVTVHAKIARGAFANWLITQRVSLVNDFKKFSDLGYRYDKSLSTPNQPVFVCEQFGGIGLSVRLTKG